MAYIKKCIDPNYKNMRSIYAYYSKKNSEYSDRSKKSSIFELFLKTVAIEKPSTDFTSVLTHKVRT